MNKDRFAFRVWDKSNRRYLGADKVLNNNGTLYRVEGAHPNNDLTLMHLCHEEDYILEQCTGLKDKNGRLIFEGDIVEVNRFIECLGENLGVFESEDGFKAVVGFGSVGIFLERENENSGPLWSYCGIDWRNGQADELEIIGNIHQDSHLLEAE